MTTPPRVLVFTDLDGSLLDHQSYSHAPALPMLERLRNLGIPLIPASSKTEAEILALRETLGNDHPFIIENGAAVLVPKGYFARPTADARLAGGYEVKSFCEGRAHWLAVVERLRPAYDGEFVTFAESSIRQIREMTGLGQAAAERAALRAYGEPLRWLGSAARRDRFIRDLERLGARALIGGRFLHVSGETDKGRALRWLKARYEADGGRPCHAIAVGDSPNDLAMLEAADQALIVRSRVHAPPALAGHARATLSERFGPAGWNEGLGALLDSLPFNPGG